MSEAENEGGIIEKPAFEREETSIILDSVTFFYLLAHFWLPQKSTPHSAAVQSYTPKNLVFISLEELAVGQKINLCLTTPNVPTEGLYPQVSAKVIRVEKGDDVFEVEVVFDYELPVEAPVELTRPERANSKLEGEEQRIWKRHEVDIQAHYRLHPASELIPCKILDISNGGLRFTSNLRLKQNQKIFLLTENMGAGKLKKMLIADVLVHWIRQKKHNYFEVGGQFLNVNFKEWQGKPQ